jgi:hypothetical protein
VNFLKRCRRVLIARSVALKKLEIGVEVKERRDRRPIHRRQDNKWQKYILIWIHKKWTMILNKVGR